MENWLPLGTAGLYLGCFALSVVSALVPWVNGEVLLLSLAAGARTSLDLAVLVLLASAGQMAGKCVLYWGGRGAARFRSGRLESLAASWNSRCERSPAELLSLVFVSSAAGIPPFYVVTLLSGALRMRMGPFVGAGLCGRIVRFGVLVAAAHPALRLLR